MSWWGVFMVGVAGGAGFGVVVVAALYGIIKWSERGSGSERGG